MLAVIHTCISFLFVRLLYERLQNCIWMWGKRGEGTFQQTMNSIKASPINLAWILLVQKHDDNFRLFSKIWVGLSAALSHPLLIVLWLRLHHWIILLSIQGTILLKDSLDFWGSFSNRHGCQCCWDIFWLLDPLVSWYFMSCKCLLQLFQWSCILCLCWIGRISNEIRHGQAPGASIYLQNHLVHILGIIQISNRIGLISCCMKYCRWYVTCLGHNTAHKLNGCFVAFNDRSDPTCQCSSLVSTCCLSQINQLSRFLSWTIPWKDLYEQ